MPRRAILLTVLLAFCIPRAIAQGTGGLLPDPISTADLIEWFDALYATKDQRAQILALHDEYLVKCRALREGRIQALLDLDRVAHPTNPIGFLGDDRDLQRFVRDLEAINTEIARLDEVFLGGAASTFPENEDQFERIGGQRRRDRLLSDPIARWWLAPFSYPEIREVTVAAKLTEEQISLIEPLVREYERDFTGQMHRLVHLAHEHLLDYRRGLREAGMEYDPNHERGGAIQEQQLEIWMARREAPADHATRIAQLRVDFVATAATALSTEAGHRFRLAFNLAGGSAMRHDWHGRRLDQEIDLVLVRADIAPADWIQVVELREEYHRQWARLHDELMDAVVEAYGGVTHFTNADAEERQESYLLWAEEWLALCQALAEKTRAAIRGAIGLELAAEMSAAYDRWLQERRSQNRADEPDAILAHSPNRKSLEQLQFLPLQITRADFDRYVAQLGLSEHQTKSARHAFHEYLDALRALAADQLDDLYRAAAWSENPETGVLEPPLLSEFERVEANRDRLILAMDALHERFLQQLGSLVDDDEQASRLAIIKWHREARSLAEYQSSLVADWSGHTEVQTNLVDAILDASLPEASTQAALAIALDHAAEFRSCWQSHFNAQRQLLLEYQRSMIDLAPYYARKATVDEIIHSEPVQRSRAFMDAVIATRNEVIALSRAVLAEIEAALPAHQANSMRLCYLREAYPTLFADPGFDEGFVSRAMSLAGVSDEQKIDLAIVEWDHAQSYAELSMQMCDILRQSPDQGMWGSGNSLEAMNDRKTHQEQVDRLRFYRDEFNHRARLNVQDILTPEQWAALTSAPAPIAYSN